MMIDIVQSTDMTNLILALGYTEVREIYEIEIDEEVSEAYQEGIRAVEEEDEQKKEIKHLNKINFL